MSARMTGSTELLFVKQMPNDRLITNDLSTAVLNALYATMFYRSCDIRMS
jgi:hypothetical protein